MPATDDFESMIALQYHYPAGTSINVAAHLSQIRMSGHFAFLDYGEEENLNLYGSGSVSTYPLEDIQVPIAMLASEYDTVMLPENIEWLIPQLATLVDENWYPYDHNSPLI